MSWEIKDPRWTAYLLGELSEAETAEAEKHLHDDADLQAEVERLRIVIQSLNQELSKEPPPVFDPLRREAVLKNQKPQTRFRVWIPTAAAALLAVGFGISHYIRPPLSAPSSSPLPEKVQDQDLYHFDQESASEPMSRALEDSPASSDFSLPAEEAEILLMSAPSQVPVPAAVTAPAMPPVNRRSEKEKIIQNDFSPVDFETRTDIGQEQHKTINAMGSAVLTEASASELLESTDEQKSELKKKAQDNFSLQPTPTPTATPTPTPQPESPKETP